MYTKNKYQTLVRLNNASDAKPIMFMVHPGIVGCEVYAGLANKLTDYYLCYGVDNYNLHHAEKILTLNELSKYYLEVMQTEVNFNHKNTEIGLLGWSLGGLIALEIASILEQYGYIKIKVYLLDTIIRDKQFNKISNKLDIHLLKRNLQSYVSSMYDSSYVQKIMANYDVECNMVKEATTNKLKHTEIILYKAMQKDTRIETEINDLLYDYTKILKYNNVETLVCDTTQIKLIKIKNAHHGNIIENNGVYETIIETAKIHTRNSKKSFEEV